MSTGNISIDKEVHIIGAGYRVDSSQATSRTDLDGNIYLITGADSSSFEGFYLSGGIGLGYLNTNLRLVNDLSFVRVNVGGIDLTSYYFQWLWNGQSSNCLISECVVRNYLRGYGYRGLRVEKTIFTNCNLDPLQSCTETLFLNNVFLLGSNPSIGNNDSSCVFKNNVFIGQSPIYESVYFSNSYEYSLSNTAISLPLQTNSYENVSNIFVNQVCGNSFESQDFHLQNPSSYPGTDGTQVGIYGTGLPFKDGAFPSNPHIAYKSIAPGTDSDGNLQINMIVTSQDH